MSVDTPIKDMDEICPGPYPGKGQTPTGEMTITLHISEEAYG